MGNVGKPARARREYLDALDELDRIEGRLRDQLRTHKRLRTITRRHLERGGTAAELRELMDIKQARGQADDVLRALATERWRAQCAVYRLAAAEGMTAAEIGRSWGVSRQLVSRVLNRDDGST